MQVFSILAVVACAIGLAAAVPTPNDDVSVVLSDTTLVGSKDSTGITGSHEENCFARQFCARFCSSGYGDGTCMHLKHNVCTQFIPGLVGSLSSYWINPITYCDLYENDNCRDNGNWSRIQNRQALECPLTNVTPNMGNRYRSARCFDRNPNHWNL